MKAKIAIAVAMLLFAGLANAQDDGVAWEALSEQQQRGLSNFSENWDSLDAARQSRLAMGADRWSKMTPEQRNAAQNRFKQWRDLAPNRAIINLVRELCRVNVARQRQLA